MRPLALLERSAFRRGTERAHGDRDEEPGCSDVHEHARVTEACVQERDGERVVKIEEKPAEPKSEYAVIGIYMYDARVFEIIRVLKPSGRGELEITDVNNAYIERGEMTWDVLEGWWSDAGTFESLLQASNLVAETGANNLELAHAAESGANA